MFNARGRGEVLKTFWAMVAAAMVASACVAPCGSPRPFPKQLRASETSPRTPKERDTWKRTEVIAKKKQNDTENIQEPKDMRVLVFPFAFLLGYIYIYKARPVASNGDYLDKTRDEKRPKLLPPPFTREPSAPGAQVNLLLGLCLLFFSPASPPLSLSLSLSLTLSLSLSLSRSLSRPGIQAMVG